MRVIAILLLDILHDIVSSIVVVVGLYAFILTSPVDSWEKEDMI